MGETFRAMARTPGASVGQFGSFQLEFTTPVGRVAPPRPFASCIQDFTPQHFFSGALPPWVDGASMDANDLQEELDACRKRQKTCEAENERLRSMLEKTKMFTPDQLGGVIKRRGPKVKKPSRNRQIALDRADAVLDIAQLFQGTDFAANVEHIF